MKFMPRDILCRQSGSLIRMKEGDFTCLDGTSGSVLLTHAIDKDMTGSMLSVWTMALKASRVLPP